MDGFTVATIARDFGPAGVLGIIVVVLFLRSQYLAKELEKKADDRYNEEQHTIFKDAISLKADNLRNDEQHREFSISLSGKMDKEWCQRMHGNLVQSFDETKKNIREDVRTLHEKLDRLTK